MNKQKWLIVGLSLAMAATLGVGISACGGEKEPDTPPTPTEHTHTYDAWDYDETQHWKYCDEHGTDKSNIDESTKANHSFGQDGKCECGATEGEETPDADLDTREFYVVGGGMGTLKNGTWDGPKTGFQFAKAPHKDANGNTVYTFTMELYSADEFKFIEKNAITQETDASGNSKAVWHDELVFTLPDLDVSSVTGAFARASETSDNITVLKDMDGEYEFTIRTQKDGDMKANKVEVRLVKELEPLGIESQYEMYLVGKIASKATSDWPSMLGVANVPSKCYKMELQDDEETFAIEVELSKADQWKVWNYKVGNVNAGYYPTGVEGNLSTGGGPDGWYRVTWKVGDANVTIAHAHRYTAWDYDTEEHWKKCVANDGSIDDTTRAPHDFSNGDTCECGYKQEADPNWKIDANGTFQGYEGDFENLVIPANLKVFPEALGDLFGKLNDANNYPNETNWKKVKSVTVAPGNKKFKMENGALLSADGKTLYAYFYYNTATEVTFESVETVGHSAFCYNDKLQTVNLPNAVTLNKFAFLETTAIKDLSFPKVETLTGSAIADSSATSITLESVTTMPMSSINGCNSLTTVVLGDKLKTVGASMTITQCPQLTSITVKATTPPAGVTGSFAAFCHKELKIYVPEGSVDAYKTAWKSNAAKIFAITEAVSVAPVEVAMLPEKKD